MPRWKLAAKSSTEARTTGGEDNMETDGDENESSSWSNVWTRLDSCRTHHYERKRRAKASSTPATPRRAFHFASSRSSSRASTPSRRSSRRSVWNRLHDEASDRKQNIAATRSARPQRRSQRRSQSARPAKRPERARRRGARSRTTKTSKAPARKRAPKSYIQRLRLEILADRERQTREAARDNGQSFQDGTQTFNAGKLPAGRKSPPMADRNHAIRSSSGVGGPNYKGASAFKPITQGSTPLREIELPEDPVAQRVRALQKELAQSTMRLKTAYQGIRPCAAEQERPLSPLSQEYVKQIRDINGKMQTRPMNSRTEPIVLVGSDAKASEDKSRMDAKETDADNVMKLALEFVDLVVNPGARRADAKSTSPDSQTPRGLICKRDYEHERARFLHRIAAAGGSKRLVGHLGISILELWYSCARGSPVVNKAVFARSVSKNLIRACADEISHDYLHFGLSDAAGDAHMSL